MRILKMTAVVAALAALTPSVSGPFDSPALAQGRQNGRELTIMSGRGGELGVSVSDAQQGGVEIKSVSPDGAAEKAGLKSGDIIVEFDGEHVRGSRQFARLVQETPSGRSVKATIVRDGKRQDVQVTPSEGGGRSAMRLGDAFGYAFGDRFGDRFEFAMPREMDRLRDLPRDLPFNFNFDFPMIASGRLGVEVETLTTQLAQYFGAKEGVLVRSVTDASPASRAGIKAGDVITSVNGATIGSRDELLRAMGDVNTDSEVTIGIVRDRKETTVKAKIDTPRRTIRNVRPA